MAILNFGSLCIDNVYKVAHFVAPGETLACLEYQIHAGGKGLNQSLAIARAGTSVSHAGRVGHEGLWMVDLLSEAGVDTQLIRVSDHPGGHAVIQVNQDGENAIVIYGGANQEINRAEIDEVLARFSPGDFLLIQNEISQLEYLIQEAASRELRIVFNAAPMTETVTSYPLNLVEMFMLNDIEGQAISGQSRPDDILDAMMTRYPQSKVILTLGSQGAIYRDKDQTVSQSAFEVSSRDTTGAGDTFTGYFLAEYSSGTEVKACLMMACKAAALCVTREGAASSIPGREELAILD